MNKLRHILIVLLITLCVCVGSSFGQSKKCTPTILAAPPTVKVYRALLFQTLDMPTLSPEAVVLENTVGAIVWSRDGAGSFRATLPNGFPVNKTFVRIPTSISSRLDMIENYLLDTNVLIVTTSYNGVFYDYMLNTTPVEILVYP